MHIRSFSWGKANLSWSVVMDELLHAAEQLGHDVSFFSTNSVEGMKYWNDIKVAESLVKERALLRQRKSYDIDITYTVPSNFQERFLSSSKVKMAVYNYESSIMPSGWKKFYHLVDYVLPSSQYVADMFIRNGCPADKVKVVPHGVDLEVFNRDVPPMELPTDKKFKFLCVSEPHYRKQIDKLLEVYFKTFTAKDDVCLIIKTKIFRNGEEKRAFEMDLRPKIISLLKKHGKNAPEFKVISQRLPDIAPLYTACDAFVLMTASEGWGVPYLEALATGLPVIAPRHGGQMQFLNDDNALLCDTGTRLALDEEQYWGGSPGAVVGDPDEDHFSQLMLDMYRDYTKIKARLDVGMKTTADSLTWKNAMQEIVDIAQESGKIHERTD